MTNTFEARILKKELGVSVSSQITMTKFDDVVTLTINKPYTNMQSDYSCFEGVVIATKAKETLSKVKIAFSLMNWDGKFESLTTDQGHYMRFLYRVWKFTKYYDWAEVADENRKIVEYFEKKFSNSKLICNFPSSKANFNPNKGKEHVLEVYFEKNQNKLQNILDLYSETKLKEKMLFNQFPNGLFEDEIVDKTRIFPTGYFDLWGINEKNELCIFELKKDGNKKIGIISELFFYANYAKDILCDANVLPEIEKKTNHRGYKEMLEICGNKTKLKAYFLIEGNMHSDLEGKEVEICEILNQFRPNEIEFSILKFNLDESEYESFVSEYSKI